MSEPKKAPKKSLLSTLAVIVIAILLLVGQQLGLLPDNTEQATETPTLAIAEQLTAAPALETAAAEPTEQPTTTPEPTQQAITEPQALVNYLAAHNGELPDNFLTKAEAQALGWDTSSTTKRYVSSVAPGRSIGGDRFGNYEGLLPKASGRTYREADCYYTTGARNGYRLVWSNDGLYFYTDDHYETFTEMFPE